MAAVVYFLCAATSILCAGLVVRAWRRSKIRLLAWVAAGFVGLAVNNVILFVDRFVVPDTDLQALREGSGLAAVAVLLCGLVWESR